MIPEEDLGVTEEKEICDLLFFLMLPESLSGGTRSPYWTKLKERASQEYIWLVQNKEKSYIVEYLNTYCLSEIHNIFNYYKIITRPILLFAVTLLPLIEMMGIT